VWRDADFSKKKNLNTSTVHYSEQCEGMLDGAATRST